MRVGSWVRLKERVRRGAQAARIEMKCPSLATGAVRLDRPLDGLTWWNEADLVATRAPKTARKE